MTARCYECGKAKVTARVGEVDVCETCFRRLYGESMAQEGENMLSPALGKTFATLKMMVEADGKFPSMRQMCRVMGWKSPQSATWALRKMAEVGLVTGSGKDRKLVERTR